MKSTYQENQRERSTNLIENSELFEGVLGGRKFFGKERKFVLSDEEKNIFKPLRSDVIDYFKNNRISWWGGKKPTGHVLSSQIACINHLFFIRNDKHAVLQMVRTISDDFVDVFEISTDKYNPAYIQFEAVSDIDHLNEGKPSRGNNCTSIDALVYAQHKDGTLWIIPIEWKYTEYYNNQNRAVEGYKKDPVKCKGVVRKKRYTNLINNSDQLENSDHQCYYYEPFYQLMRQTLWAEQLVKNSVIETIKAENYLHVHVIPSDNKDLLYKIYKCSQTDMKTTWEKQLKDKSKYIIISPEKLLTKSLSNIKYNELKNYLTKRYW